MEAIILAGGYGTRLYPLTKNTAKPLVEVSGTPIITRILHKVSDLDFDRVHVVTNDKFAGQLSDWAENVDTSHDVHVYNDGTKQNGERLGTLGDIQFVVDEADIEDDVFVIGGDNLFEFDLEDLVEFYEEKSCSVIAAKDLESKEKVADSFGVVETSGDEITGFEEKPSEPKSTLASTLLYVLSTEDLERLSAYIDEGHPADDAGNFIAYLVEHSDVAAYTFTDHWFDIGTKERLDEAEQYYD
jgi:glucose-1-phosphate thymidylyltransferase